MNGDRWIKGAALAAFVLTGQVALAGLTPQPGFNNSPKRIELQYFYGGQQGWSKMPAVEAQGVLVMAESFNRQQSISYGGNTVGRIGG